MPFRKGFALAAAITAALAAAEPAAPAPVPALAIEAPAAPALSPSPVFARVAVDTPLRSAKSAKSKPTAQLAAGSNVEILQDYSEAWYYVQDAAGAKGWLPAAALEIPPDPPTDLSEPDARALEAFAAQYGSKTSYLLLVDVARQRTYVFIKEQPSASAAVWRLERSLVCATGKNASPTTRGAFTVSDRGTWFYSERLGSGAKYWLRFNGAYLFHSVAMDKRGAVVDDELGLRRSSGCVRLATDDAKWLYDFIPAGTAAVVY